jgi:hypothetical protein
MVSGSLPIVVIYLGNATKNKKLQAELTKVYSNELRADCHKKGRVFLGRGGSLCFTELGYFFVGTVFLSKLRNRHKLHEVVAWIATCPNKEHNRRVEGARNIYCS